MALKAGIIRSNGLNKWEMQGYEHLPENGVDVSGVCSTDNRYDTSKIKFPVLKFRRFASINRIPLLRSGLQYFFPYDDYFLNFRKIAEKFDVLHSIDPFFPFSYQCARSGKPSVFTFWENIPFNNERFAYGKFKKYVYRHGTHFVAVTEKSRECMIKEGLPESKISLIYPGIDLGRFKPQKKDKKLMDKYGIEKDSFSILFSGRLVREKGIDVLMKAFRRLCQKQDSTNLLILGSGPLKSRIQKYAKENNIDRNVHFLGFMDYTETHKIYNLSDAFCVPSIPLYTHLLKWEEQFGYVFAEAMACGKPVVSTDSGSIPDVVGNGGLLAKPGDAKSLFSHLNSLIEDKSICRRISRRGLKLAKERYDSRIMSRKLAELYKRIA